MRSCKIYIFLLIIIASFSMDGCKPKYHRQEIPTKQALPDQESILRSNQLMIKQDVQSIKDKAAVRGWSLIETGTGVFYHRYNLASGQPAKKIQPGDKVTLAYKLSLLDGTGCYSSKNQGLKQFTVEKSEAESGLHEAIQFLYPGDSALIILPPYRAFGLTGDGNRIPPRATLVYEIHIDSVIRHE
jgi:FKBP-type peptidyl-prolyl cis-trans isomerase FkpA